MESTNNTFPFSVLSYIPMRFAEEASGVSRRVFTETAGTIASFLYGIPAVYSIPPKQGGKLVERGDINGIGWLGTNLQKFAQDGGVITFNEAYCTTINGYPKGAILCMYEATKGYYLVMSTKDGNTDNFLEHPSYIGPNNTDSWMQITPNKEDLEKIAEEASRAYKFKGSVATYDDLPKSGNKIGDVYDVQDTHQNYAYAGSGKGEREDGWDSLGKVFDLFDYVAKSEAQSELSDSTLPPTTKLLQDEIAGAKTYADGVGTSTLASAVAKNEVQTSVSESTLPPTTKLLKEQIAAAEKYADGVGETVTTKAVLQTQVVGTLQDSSFPPSTTLLKSSLDALDTAITSNAYTFKGTKATKASLPSSASANDVWMVMADGKYYAYASRTWNKVSPTTDLLAQHLCYLSQTS